jgi:hypothetical protein
LVAWHLKTKNIPYNLRIFMDILDIYGGPTNGKVKMVKNTTSANLRF